MRALLAAISRHLDLVSPGHAAAILALDELEAAR